LAHPDRSSPPESRAPLDRVLARNQTRPIERSEADSIQAHRPEQRQNGRAPTHGDAIGAVRAARRARIGPLPPDAALALQRSIGNRNLGRVLARQRPAKLDAPRPARVRPTRGSWALQRYVNYSRSAAAAYARKWAMTDNPAYGRIEPNDCTNFVSQALLAGGWTMVGGSCDDRKDNTAWWFKPMDCRWVGGRPWTTEVKASFTWGGAQNLYWFMKESGRGADVSDPMDLEIGDVLQMDMGTGHYNAGRIGHSMIVTDKSATDLFLSYHEDHHLDEPLSAIKSRYPSARWYPWKPGGAPGDYELPRGDSQAA
jgi:Putative amidase domain